MHHTHISTGLKGIFPVIIGTYIKPLFAIQPLCHPTPLSPVMYQGKARKSIGEKKISVTDCYKFLSIGEIFID
jgi:hypothetical protein